MGKCNYKTFETAWCPGCGDFNILESLKMPLQGFKYSLIKFWW